MTPEYDWLGDCAESYVAYLFSKADFEVFAASKWGADLAIRNNKNKSWLRVEVKSTNTNKSLSAILRSRREQLKKAELLAFIRLKDGVIESSFYKLQDGKRNGEKCTNPTTQELAVFLK
ncbi:MAG: hypothetical protein WC459_02730 [Patescibacteria group bacterium]